MKKTKGLSDSETQRSLKEKFCGNLRESKKVVRSCRTVAEIRILSVRAGHVPGKVDCACFERYLKD